MIVRSVAALASKADKVNVSSALMVCEVARVAATVTPEEVLPVVFKVMAVA